MAPCGLRHRRGCSAKLARLIALGHSDLHEATVDQLLGDAKLEFAIGYLGFDPRPPCGFRKSG